MKKCRTVLGVVTLAVAGIIVLGWMFVVPGEVKTLVRFSRWHDAHVRSSGYVDREPAGTRIYWSETFALSQSESFVLECRHDHDDDGGIGVLFRVNHTAARLATLSLSSYATANARGGATVVTTEPNETRQTA
jgi:hypothetical protein